MSTTSAPYFVFLILVFFGYWLLANRSDWRVIFLVIASCFFYSHAGAGAVLLLLAVSTIDYTVSRLMSGSPKDGTFRRGIAGLSSLHQQRKTLLLISLVTDIGVLCVFKYANFFLDSAGSILSTASLP